MHKEFSSKLKLLAETYAEKLPEKFKQINWLWSRLEDGFQQQIFVDFHRNIHNLAGSTGTYGYIRLSKVARKLEVYLHSLLPEHSLTPAQKENITFLLKELNEIKEANPVLIGNQNNIADNGFSKVIYLLDDDINLFNELNKNLSDLGYEVKQYNDLTTFESESLRTTESSSAVILNSELLNSLTLPVITDRLKEQGIPLICISYKTDLETRLLAVRAGSLHFLLKPLNVSHLTKIVDTLCGNISSKTRIVILDDSISVGEYYSVILQEAGMETVTLSDARELLTVLNEFQPDLLLLDLYMPFCSGLEVATILRQEERYASLPIIFISSEDDKIKQLATISGGGDDFLIKPILPQHMINTIKSRVKRAAMLTPYIKHDGLTQLLNHTYIVQQLELDLLRSLKQNQSLSFAMVDIDNFKKINDTLGHLAGDAVLARVSEYLSTRLRARKVGRYGGEEFAIIFPNTTLEAAVAECEVLCSDFSTLENTVNGNTFCMSFSVGVSSCPECQTVEEIISSADDSLYQAKELGKNRVFSLLLKKS